MRYLAPLFLLLACFSVSAQEKCMLKIDQSPTVRGLKLGQAIAETHKVLQPAYEAEAGEFGVGSEMFVAASFLDKRQAEGVQSGRIKYLDGYIIEISISYEGTKWRDSVEFTDKLSASLKLPNLWEGTVARHLNCDGFLMQAYAVGSNGTIKLTDKSGEKEVRKREADKEERGRQSFKP